VAERLSEYELAYLHMVTPALEQMQNGKEPDPDALDMAKLVRNRFRGTLIVAGGFDAESGARWLREG
jgi:N-ethylmaleimide reductase